MKIIIVGCGYVGLVSGACFAELGHHVMCVDIDKAKIARLKCGEMPIYEPGLDCLVARNLEARRLSFSPRLPSIGDDVDVVMIAVGTPPAVDGSGANLSYIYAVAADIALKAEKRVLVVTKSTVPAGTGDTIERIIGGMRPDLELSVASNPEFLREGSAISDFLEPDRIVIGTDDPDARDTLKRLYQPLISMGTPVVVTARTAAEIIKYSANAFLAIKITFINEIADLCEVAAVDVRDVATGIGLDHRIGRDFLKAGPGYGGSCFPKDSAALVATAHEMGVDLRLVETAISINDRRKTAMGVRVIHAVGGDIYGKTVAVLGLTFKAKTDDMRDSPAVAMIAVLQNAGAHIRAFDPQGMVRARETLCDITYATDAYDCADGADCIVLATDWPEFAHLDLARLAHLVRQPVFIDLRNVFDRQLLADAGFRSYAIGSPPPIYTQNGRPAPVEERVAHGNDDTIAADLGQADIGDDARERRGNAFSPPPRQLQ